MSNEKLTIQALIEHDRVQPKFKATKSSNNSTGAKETGSVKNGEVTQRRRRVTSTSDTKSQKSVTIAPPPHKPGINFFRIVAATKAWHRLAKQRAAKRSSPKPTQKLENSYRLEPAEGKHFSPDKVEQVLRTVIDNHPGLAQYNPIRCKLMVRDLTERINEKVKELDFPRYKLVSNVIIMERKDQGVNIASRCVWNHRTDNFASYTYKNSAVIVVAYVHGVYFE